MGLKSHKRHKIWLNKVYSFVFCNSFLPYWNRYKQTVNWFLAEGLVIDFILIQSFLLILPVWKYLIFAVPNISSFISLLMRRMNELGLKYIMCLQFPRKPGNLKSFFFLVVILRLCREASLPLKQRLSALFIYSYFHRCLKELWRFTHQTVVL